MISEEVIGWLFGAVHFPDISEERDRMYNPRDKMVYIHISPSYTTATVGLPRAGR